MKRQVFGARGACPVGQAFNRRDGFGADAADAGHARAGGGSIEQDGTRTALAFTTTVPAAGQAEVVPEDGQEAVAGLGVNLSVLPVDAQNVPSHTAIFSWFGPR
jgi:hypothetical protein